jgi:hypothetical protein
MTELARSATGDAAMTEGYHIYAPPPAVGEWVFQGFVHIPLDKKPRWLTRLCAHLFFELRWVDFLPGNVQTTIAKET